MASTKATFTAQVMVLCLLTMEIAIRLVGVDVVRNKSYYSASYKHLPNI